MDKYFSNLTDRERAIFEGAVSMGALYHQFVGTPVSIKTIDSLECAIKESIELQPAVENVEVNLDYDMILEVAGKMGYISLDGNMLNVEITTKINDTEIITCIEYIDELDYPLMYVKD